MTMISSWFSFVSFTVFPVAFRELLHWLYDWQILLTGILALIAARYWGRSVIKAARITARARAATPEFKRAPGEPVVVPIPLATPAAGDATLKPPRMPEWSDRLFALRENIRATLGKLPCTDEVLNAERLAECKKIAEFPLGELPGSSPKALAHRYETLHSKLAALGAVRETDSCRNAWEALVKISIDARDLMSPEPAKTPGKVARLTSGER